MEAAIKGGKGNEEFGKLSINEHSIQLLARPWGYCFVAYTHLQLNEGVVAAGMEGKLIFRFHGSGESFYFGQALTEPRPLVISGGDFNTYVDIDQRTLHAYEVKRLQSGGGEVQVELALRPLIWRQSELILHPQSCRFSLTLPVSRWADLLRSAGYSLVALHRLIPPIIPPKPTDRGRRVIEQFQRAERLLIQGQPNEAAQQCRIVLDLFAQVYAGDSAFEQNTIDKMLGAIGADGKKRQKLKLLFAQIKQVTNDPLHPDLDAEYDSNDARLLLSITALTIEFFANQLPSGNS